MHENTKAYLLLFISLVFLSLDAVTVRLIGIDGISTAFLRTAIIAIVMIVFCLYSVGFDNCKKHIKNMTFKQFISCLLFGISGIFFTLAILNTTVINVMIMYALSPLFGVIFSAIFLKETINKVVKFTSVFVVIGTFIAYKDTFSGQFEIGIFYAFMFVISNSSMSIVSRGLKQIPSFLIIGIGCSFWTIILLLTTGMPQLPTTPFAWGNLIFNSVVIVAFGYWVITYASKRISAPEVNLILVNESFLGTLMAAIILFEIPNRESIIGGLIVFIAVLINISYSVYLRKKN